MGSDDVLINPRMPPITLDAEGYVSDDDSVATFWRLTRQAVLSIEENPDHDPTKRPQDGNREDDRKYWAMPYEEFVSLASEVWTHIQEQARAHDANEEVYDARFMGEGIVITGENVKQVTRRGGMSLFADDGFCTLEAATDVYAAAIMCTSAETVGLGDVHLPSLSFICRVPPGLIDAEYIWFDAAHFGQHQLQLRSARKRTLRMCSDTIDDLLFSPLEETDVTRLTDGAIPKVGAAFVRNASDEEVRMFIMARHYVAGLVIAYQAKSNWTYEGLRLSQAKRIRSVPPEHRYVILGKKKVRADVREGVKRYVNGAHHRSPSVQFVVRGHYRNQAHGPKHGSHRIIWIEPYWKTGKNVDAPVLARTHLLHDSESKE